MTDVNPLHLKSIVRVAAFRDVIDQELIQAFLAGGIIMYRFPLSGKGDLDGNPISRLDECRDGRNREDIGRQQTLTEQRVEQGAFPPLELPEDRQMKTPGSEPVADVSQLIGQ